MEMHIALTYIIGFRRKIMNNYQYLVNRVLPNSGNSMTTKAYRDALANMGYNRYEQIGSIGGTSGRSTAVANGTITRK